MKHLKRRFAPGKTFTYYNAQLNGIGMLQSETVGDFRDRLNILLGGAENALKEEKGTGYVAAMMDPMKDASIDIFIRGLPYTISSAMDACHPKTLEEAYLEAVRIESRIKSRILPDARMPAATPYNEANELSQNFKSRPSHYGLPPQSHQSEGAPRFPAYIGYVESGESNPAPEYIPPEEQETPYVGYFYPGSQELQQPGVQISNGDRASFSPYGRGRGGYRGRDGYRGYAQGPPRPKEQLDPRLYYPNSQQSQSGFTLGLPPSHGPPTSYPSPQGSLNSLGARPEISTASPVTTPANPQTTSQEANKQPNPSHQTNQSTSTPRVFLARTPVVTQSGLVPVAQLIEKMHEKMSLQ